MRASFRGAGGSPRARTHEHDPRNPMALCVHGSRFPRYARAPGSRGPYHKSSSRRERPFRPRRRAPICFAMDHSLLTAGRSTHVKIVIVALLGAILVVSVGIGRELPQIVLGTGSAGAMLSRAEK